MENYVIEGGRKLFGQITVSPAKNACLPIISAILMLPCPVFLEDAPNISDVVTMAQIAEDSGGEYEFKPSGLFIKCSNVKSYSPSPSICRRARASFFTAGALLTRFKKAVMPLPGGCNLGKRPIDIHIDAFRQLGVLCNEEESRVVFDGKNMKSGHVILAYPSVGATVNTINASVMLEGETVIENTAKEPEITDLCNFLNKCGCNIYSGDGFIVINGVKNFTEQTVVYRPIPDRIEAGTYMTAVSACGGELVFPFENFEIISKITQKLKEGGVKIGYTNNTVHLVAEKPFENIDVTADVYPFFPTDMQPQFTALSLSGKGTCYITDNVFKKRFLYVDQLKKMGADIEVDFNHAKITGGKKLHGANLVTTDLRGGAALVIASLIAEGTSVVENISLINRGYKDMCGKLFSLGANIKCLRDG